MPNDVAQQFRAAQVLVDRDGAVRMWSEDCVRLFGYRTEEAIGRPVDFIIVPAYRDRHWRGFRSAMAATATERPHGVGNIPVLHADGSVHAHPYRQMILFDAFGRPTGAIVIFSEAVQAGTSNGLRDAFFDGFDQPPGATA